MNGTARRPLRRAHRELVVWQEAISLVQDVYAATASFPREEIYALTSQMQRAAVSVPSNIAEGAARRTRAELTQFIGVAQGSLSELDTQAEIAVRLGYLAPDHEVFVRMDRVFSLLLGLARSIPARPAR